MGKKTLDERIKNLKKDYVKKDSKLKDNMPMGYKVLSEIIASLFLGGFLGYGFDRLCDTSPWGLIVIMLLFISGAVYNILKHLGKIKFDVNAMDKVPEIEEENK